MQVKFGMTATIYSEYLVTLQIACILNRENDLPIEKIVNYIKSLQQPNGGFFGDKWGELDSRFSFCAVACLSLLVGTFSLSPLTLRSQNILKSYKFQGRLDAIDLQKAVDYVMACNNFDGGFGSRPDSESHAGLIYCCVGFLSVTSKSYEINVTFPVDLLLLLQNIRFLQIIFIS